MFGYMSEKEAKEAGFQSHGDYYGIPCYISELGNDELMVAAKWSPLDYIFPLVSWIEVTMQSILYPDTEPNFMFRIGDPLSDD